MEKVNPWARYWAWSFDMLICAGSLMWLILIFCPVLMRDWDFQIGFLSTLLWMFFDALCVYKWGATPGKRLLNIEVKKENGLPATFKECLKRSFTIFYKGLGMGIILINFVTQILSYINLKKNGITPWDKEGGFIVSHKDLSVPRIISIVLLFILFYVLIFTMSFAFMAFNKY